MFKSCLLNHFLLKCDTVGKVAIRGVRRPRTSKMTKKRDILSEIDNELFRDADLKEVYKRGFDGWDLDEIDPGDNTQGVGSGHSTILELQSEAERQKRKLKQQILRKKESKNDYHPNLLTWKAKEQIKYLLTDSTCKHTWTVDKVAECFPATHEAILKIARDMQRLSEKERERHDERVRKKWKLILRKGFEDENQLKFLMESGKMEILCNAAGLEDLEVPKHFMKKFQMRGILDSKRGVGPFESLVHGYLKTRKEGQLDVIESGVTSTKSFLHKDRKLLDYISKKFLDLKNAESPISEKDSDIQLKSIKSLKHNVIVETEKPKGSPDTENRTRNTEPMRIVQKGNVYYDENGEFIYRVP